MQGFIGFHLKSFWIRRLIMQLIMWWFLFDKHAAAKTTNQTTCDLADSRSHNVAEYKHTHGFTGFPVETCTPTDTVTALCQSQTPCSSAMMTRRTVALNFCMLTQTSICASNCIIQDFSSNRLQVHFLRWGPGVNTPACQEVPFWLFIKKKKNPAQPEVQHGFVENLGKHTFGIHWI